MNTARVTYAFAGAVGSFAMPMDGRTLIEGADAAGIELPSQCRAGVCATCRTRVVNGRVQMRDSSALEPHELSAGFVLACQSVPLTEELALEFDES
jgi:ring-1,2-phenylacetyl-CoA epoxidase subunit PaaE